MNVTAVECGLLFFVVITLAVVLTRGMIVLAHSKEWVVKPKADRWSQTPTALFGGVAIVAAFAVGAAAAMALFGASRRFDLIGLFVGGAILFAIGVRDDVRPLNPQVKLIGQILAIMPFLVGGGLEFTSTTFVLSIPLVLFWMLALANGFNLLDNMDGLCAGTAAIAGTAIAGYSLLHQLLLPGVLALLVTAACLGFLVYNFRARGPARIFMGDCGSMFLGFMLSGLAVIAFCPAKPIPFDLRAAQCVLPLLIMAMPIFDTTLVIIIRKREGRAVSQGGRDHSSHRLVYAGYTDKQAVVMLGCISAVGGGIAVVLGQLHTSVIVFGAILVEAALLAWFGVYLNRFREANRPILRPLVHTDLSARVGEVENGRHELAEAGFHQERN